jgi:hypothetical protein
MNSSLYSADCATHLRIIAVAMTIDLTITGFATWVPSGSIGGVPAMKSSGQTGKAAVPGRKAIASQRSQVIFETELRHPQTSKSPAA